MNAIVWEYSYKPRFTKNTSVISQVEVINNILRLFIFILKPNNNTNALTKQPK